MAACVWLRVWLPAYAHKLVTWPCPCPCPTLSVPRPPSLVRVHVTDFNCESPCCGGICKANWRINQMCLRVCLRLAASLAERQKKTWHWLTGWHCQSAQPSHVSWPRSHGRRRWPRKLAKVGLGRRLWESEISQLGPGSGYSWVARLFVTLCMCVCVPALYVCQFLCMSWAGSASTRELLAPETVAVARLKRIL